MNLTDLSTRHWPSVAVVVALVALFGGVGQALEIRDGYLRFFDIRQQLYWQTGNGTAAEQCHQCDDDRHRRPVTGAQIS